MAIEGFRTEWFTVGEHRVYLEARASFPGDEHKLIATVVAKTLDHNTERARLVRVFFDDKASVYGIDVATTQESDTQVAGKVNEILHAIFNTGNYYCDVLVVDKGDESSDHYHHTEHLSVAAGLASDRWARN